jgi:phosphotransferase system HPr-like phosphotransfer protein
MSAVGEHVSTSGTQHETRARFRITHPSGLHARPLALICARLLTKAPRVTVGVRRVGDPLPSLRTPFGLLSTGYWLPVLAGPGCIVEFIAEGPDAGNAIKVVRGVLEARRHSFTDI